VETCGPVSIVFAAVLSGTRTGWAGPVAPSKQQGLNIHTIASWYTGMRMEHKFDLQCSLTFCFVGTEEKTAICPACVLAG
jgi:hypothetical protein